MKTLNELIGGIDDTASQNQIIEALSLVVQDWLEYRTEELFSKLYRLDILEKDLQVALAKPNIPKEIAALIYERQIQKFLSRKANPPSEAPDDLKW